MSVNLLQYSPLMQRNKQFPIESEKLATELNKTYTEIANCVNERQIGVYPASKQLIAGQNWFFNDTEKRQALRQFYTFSTTGNIPHGINTSDIYSFSNCYGSYTDGTNFYMLTPTTSTSIANQNSFYITSTNIVISAGAGAPSITKGIIVLEWIV